MAEEHNLMARTTAGRAAVIVVDEQGPEIGGDMLLGFVAGFVMASAEVVGWDRTLSHIVQIAKAARAPAESVKPHLSVIVGGRA